MPKWAAWIALLAGLTLVGLPVSNYVGVYLVMQRFGGIPWSWGFLTLNAWRWGLLSVELIVGTTMIFFSIRKLLARPISSCEAEGEEAVTDRASEMLVDQRIRNRVMENLEIASSYEEQRGLDSNEIINMWEDPIARTCLSQYKEPVFSQGEQEAMREFDAIWESVADNTANPMPPLSELVGTEIWERLRVGAEKALAVFRVRGRFDEDREEFPAGPLPRP